MPLMRSDLDLDEKIAVLLEVITNLTEKIEMMMLLIEKLAEEVVSDFEDD